MDIDHILNVFNKQKVQYLLIGGIPFLLRHRPILTFDIDFWIEGSPENRRRCERALIGLDAEWGTTDKDWKKVSDLSPGWLGAQDIYCLTSPHGAIDIFLYVIGLSNWANSFSSAIHGQTASGTPYLSITDKDMLACQMGLPPQERKIDRIRELQSGIIQE